ncbi:MAG: hypothetical protein DRN81_02925 [Thermoproteota archaeon]|nr:MAG: hypothetical protein DRN81_02925 [Candidatus Korarchaeota archaeon]
MELSEIFSSRYKTKIIELLCIYGDVNVTKISKTTKVSHSQVLRFLDFLTEKKIVTLRRFGKIKIYSLNTDNPRAILLKEFFERWRKINSNSSY